MKKSTAVTTIRAAMGVVCTVIVVAQITYAAGAWFQKVQRYDVDIAVLKDRSTKSERDLDRIFLWTHEFKAYLDANFEGKKK